MPGVQHLGIAGILQPGPLVTGCRLCEGMSVRSIRFKSWTGRQGDRQRAGHIMVPDTIVTYFIKYPWELFTGSREAAISSLAGRSLNHQNFQPPRLGLVGLESGVSAFDLPKRTRGRRIHDPLGAE